MGAVMGAFSLASVLGVPASLELARLGGWRFPFLAGRSRRHDGRRDRDPRSRRARRLRLPRP
jgi:hypothetical protein